MAQYRLPDGKILEVDDNISRDNAIVLQNQLADLYPDYYQPFKEEVQQTFGGHAEEIFKGIPKGFAGTLVSAAEGVVNLFDQGNDSAVGNSLRDLQKYIYEGDHLLQTDEGYEDAFSGKFGAGLGSFASFFVPGAAVGKAVGFTGKGLSAADKLNRAQTAAQRTAFGLAVPTGISMQGRNIELARESGEEVSPGQEFFSELLGGGIGATEVLPIQRLFRYVPKTGANPTILNRLQDASVTGALEGVQEAGAAFAQDVVARGVYSDTIPIGESLLDEFTVGGAVGFVSDLAFRGVLDKRGIGRDYLNDQETIARSKMDQAKFKAKEDFKLAEAEGLPTMDPSLVPDPVPDLVGPNLPESTLQFKEIAPLEELEIITNPNGTSSVIGINTGQDYGTFNDVETAAQAATQIRQDLRNNFIDSSIKQNLSINGLYGNGTAYSLGSKVYSPESNLIPAQAVAALDSRINIGRKNKAAKQKQLTEKLDRKLIADLMGEGTLSVEEIAQLEQQLEAQATSFPTKSTKIDSSSLVGQLHTQAKKKGVAPKLFYTPAEAKKILSPADFNALMSEKAHIVFKKSAKTGDPVAIKRSREKIGVSKSDFNKVFKSKNIIADFNSPAFQYIAEQITGTKSFGAMNRGQKELLVNELKTLPRFDIETKLPDYRPRPYSVNDVNNLYTDYKGERVSNAEIKGLVKNNETGKDLTPKQLQLLREDLINSGRADKVGNRLVMSTDFEQRQAKRAQGLNETDQEFAQRLQQTTNLSQEEIAEIVAQNNINQSEVINQEEVLQLPPPESAQKYANLEKVLRKRLNDLGLPDIGLKLQNRIRSSTGIKTVNGKPVLQPRDDTVQGEFDAPMQTILVSMTKMDPDGSKTDAELEQAIAGLMDHEAIHALRELDLLTEAEYQTLVKYAKKRLPAGEIDRIDDAYRDDGQTIIEEEYVAELFRFYRDDPKSITGRPKTLIGKIINFFKGFFDGIFGSGFRTPTAILSDISTGRVGQRERGVQRSLRDLQYLQEQGIPVVPPKFSQDQEDARVLLNAAYTKLYDAERVLNADSPYVGRKVYAKLFNNVQRAQAEVDRLENEIQLTPKFSKAGITPENILFPGATEEALYSTFVDTNRNPKAEDIQAVHKAFHPKKQSPDFVDYSQLKSDVRDAVRSNIDYLWYERWGNGIPNIVGSVNMNEFSAIFGITSSQATPEQNLKDTLRAMIIARQIDPVENKDQFVAELKKFGVGKSNNQRVNDIAKLYETGLYQRSGTGQKTTTYAGEIVDAANNRFSPFSVIDRHMLRKFGIELKEGQKVSEQEYRIVQGLMALLSQENYTVNGEIRNFTPRQIQALLWGHQRYDGPTKITNEGSYDASVKAASKEITELKNLEDAGNFSKDRPFSGVFIHSPRYSSKTKSNVFDTDMKQDMYNAIVNAAPTVIFEMKMGKARGYLPENIDESVPFASFLNYQNNLINSISVGNQIRFLRDLQIPHEITQSAGTYDGYLNPNILLKLPGAEPRVVRSVAQIFTDAFMQDAAITARPVEKGILKTGLIIEKPDQSNFSVEEMQALNGDFANMERAGDQVNFTLMATNRSGLVLMDPLSFVSENYRPQDLRDFVQSILPIVQGKGYNVKRYGQESEYIEYGAESSYSPGTKSGIRGLRDRAGLIESSDLQRTALRDLYIPAYQSYKQFAKEVGFEPNPLQPFLQENSALAGEADLVDLDIAEVQAEAIKRAEAVSRGNIPVYNTNASPVALKIAFDMEAGIDLNIPEVPAKFHRTEASVPKGFEDVVNQVGGINQPKKSFGESVLDVTEWGGTVSGLLNKARTEFIDKLNDVEKGILKAADLSPEVRELENLADTSAIAALRHADRARGIFAMMVKVGTPTLKEGLTSVEDFEHGGLLQIFAPLYSDPNVNLEALFKVYAIAQRGQRLSTEGKPVPVDQNVLDKAEIIATDFPVVRQVYEQFQLYNNKVIDFAIESGILSNQRSNAELIVDIINNTDFKRSQVIDLDYDALIEIARQNGLETRGTAQIWKDNSDYYPFYRRMQDESIAGPNIASGYISGNPLNIELKGSEEAIEPAPLEAIARNQLAIVTAAMKNEGLSRLVRDLEMAEMAIQVPASEAQGADILPVFINGQKVFYKVADPLLINGLQAMGMNETGGLTKALAMPAGFLREMVTRDPGFILVNMLRDTLSTAVTSGANFTPFIDTFKNFNADVTQLERFGIIGGYDFTNDPQDIQKYIRKEMQKAGVGNNGSLTATDSVTKVWDWLGQQTTKSDGATRKAVYDKIFELTGSQAEAAFQALEIINFGRRGANPIFRLITSAIPFLNARLQGLDVLGRAHLGRYSAVRKFKLGEQRSEMAKDIALGTLMRGGFLALLTGIYYFLVSDEEEYKNARREVRDDNWIIPLGEGMPALKIPIPFEVGVLYKVIPERVIDTAMGGDINDTLKTLQRQAVTTLKIDPLGFQVIKPIVEVMNNKSSYTGQEIVPYYMRIGLEEGYQSRYGTNELARIIGEGLNISPIKIDYVLRGYGGTLGGYVLSATDALLRTQTDRDYISPRIDSMPILKRFFLTDLGGGLQQQFYELRAESDKFQQTVNSLRKQGRYEELIAYMENHQGLARTRPQLLALERYMTNWRRKRDRVLNSTILSPQQKKEILEQMEYERDMRLAYVPQLKEQASIPVVTFGL